VVEGRCPSSEPNLKKSLHIRVSPYVFWEKSACLGKCPLSRFFSYTLKEGVAQFLEFGEWLPNFLGFMGGLIIGIWRGIDKIFEIEGASHPQTIVM
jgi:hypothetical protein